MIDSTPPPPEPTRHRRTRRLSGVVVAALAMVAAIAAPSGPTDAAPSAPAADAMSLSMVELLGDENGSTVMSLDDLREDVLEDQLEDGGKNGVGIDIALIDSGVAPVDGLDGDHVLHGPDLSNEGTIPEVAYLDTYGHGTHMAGIIAGRRDGHQGIADGSRLVSLKVAGADGVTTVPQVIAAIDWVVDHRNSDGLNIRVLNLSLGLAGVDDHRGDLLSAAVERAWDAGIVVVVSAGNRGAAPGHLDSPAIDPYVIAVAAGDNTVDEDEDEQPPAWFTSHGDGDRNPDLMAPGVSIASYRVPGSTIDQQVPSARHGDDLFRGSGSSQAAAVTSGAAARILSDYPSMTPDEVKETLASSSEHDLGFGSHIVGNGMIDVEGAWEDPEFGRTQRHDRAAGRGTGIVAPSGATWTGGQWAGGQWAGATWTGATWTGGQWAGATWTGATWTGATWTGATWTGGQWAGATWTGATWTGATWTGATWTGEGWS
ncbi:MAG: S8 family serine peptidase [Actinomycetota bacterium]